MAAYLLCASPRSGSTLLCSMLKQAGAGRPHSYFRVKSIANWADRWGLPATTAESFDTNYVDKAIAAGRNGTPVFGFRSMWDTMKPMLARLRFLYGVSDDPLLLSHVFGQMNFIHLSRTDMIAQAVSLAIAEQSGLWHRNADGSILEQTKVFAEPVYSAAAVTRELNHLNEGAEGWAAWFAKTGITPHCVTYEALVADPQKELSKVLSHIGLDPKIAETITPGTAKLGDQTNQEWADRYRAQHGLPKASGLV